MSHETPTLQARRRERVGSRYARRLRSSGQLPAVIYGHETEPLSISVDAKAALSYLHDGAHVINVDIDGQQQQTCLVKALQFGYLGDDVIHIDFTRVNLDEEVDVNMTITYKGEPAAARASGAVIMTEITELSIRCKVNAIPDELVVDLSDMERAFTIADIPLPPGVKAVDDPETVVAHITFVAEEAEGEEAEVAGEAEPEVIGADEESSESGEESKD